jgi:hypothetical protein
MSKEKVGRGTSNPVLTVEFNSKKSITGEFTALEQYRKMCAEHMGPVPENWSPPEGYHRKAKWNVEASIERRFRELLFPVEPYSQPEDGFGKAFFEFGGSDCSLVCNKVSRAWSLRKSCKGRRELYIGVLYKEGGTLYLGKRDGKRRSGELVTELSKKQLLAFCDRRKRDKTLTPEQKMRWESLAFALVMSGQKRPVSTLDEKSQQEKEWKREVAEKIKRDAAWQARKVRWEYEGDDAEPESPPRKEPVRDSAEEPEVWSALDEE